MSNIQKYDEAVKQIKTAILQSQYNAARSVNEKQLTLYYGIGKYISLNSRKGFWGKGAIDAISQQLEKELPRLIGFSARNLRYMCTFYKEWVVFDPCISPNIRSIGNYEDLELTSSKLSRNFGRGILSNRLYASQGNPSKGKGL